eukprot:TRINITY_DN7608_c0_g1_i3.p1 TRINITY_DN7608_c0_g1~~TRINITY_DN7608_c0_g1_i3.p1  ORF type:complete len:1032 (-),score=256.57 TRINITY_DN7608_c0_g1_i3:107-3037(-)
MAQAGAGELRAQREGLFEALQAADAAKHSASEKRHQGSSAVSSAPVATLPRGFGHAFVTRYQMRIRYQTCQGAGALASRQLLEAEQEALESSRGVSQRSNSEASSPQVPGSHPQSRGTAVSDADRLLAGGEENWGPWEVRPDAALPKEASAAATSAGAANRAVRAQQNPHAKQYITEVPLGARSRALQVGEVLQVSVRVGDGFKWSEWRPSREVVVQLAPPRPAKERDSEFARAEWLGEVCTVSWPCATAMAGLEEVEYQLIVKPDSMAVPSRIGAMVIGTAAGRGGEPGREDGASGPTSPEMRPRGEPSGGQMQSGARFISSLKGGGADGGPDLPKDGKARKSRNILRGVDEPRCEAVELLDLCADLRYSFSVRARYPTVGPREFTQLWEVPMVAWKPLGSERSAGESAAARRLLPQVEQVALPESRQFARWQDLRLALLTWPGLEEGSSAAGALEMKHLEVQAIELKDAGRFRRGATSGSGGFSDEIADDDHAWWPCSQYSTVAVNGTPCLAMRDLPFLVGKFRLFNTATQHAGPASKPMVTIYEALSPAPPAEMVALGRGIPRTLGVKLKLPLATTPGAQARATLCQVRFRALPTPSYRRNSAGTERNMTASVGSLAFDGAAAANKEMQERGDDWEELEPAPLEETLLVREEDGLELGPVYEFSVRIGDMCRLGPWSLPSKPLPFSVAPPMPMDNSGIRVEVEADSALLSWSPFQAEATLALRMPGFKQLPIEYTINIYGGKLGEGLAEQPLTTFVTTATEARVRSLTPATSYSATLSARWTRFDGADGTADSASSKDSKRSLLAAFVTARSSRQLVAEVSVRMPGATPAMVGFPVDGEIGLQAMTLDLDPYYASVQPPHLPHAYTRKALPPPKPRAGGAYAKTAEAAASDAATAAAPAADEEEHPGDTSSGGGTKLPSLVVPAPPPRFSARNDYAALERPGVAMPDPGHVAASGGVVRMRHPPRRAPLSARS